MKKHLLSTSAIALGVAAAAPASAQEWNLDWGGFMSQSVGIVDVSGSNAALNNTDFDGFGYYSNNEIIFSPSVTLDNGLTFGVNIQLEADNQSTTTALNTDSQTLPVNNGAVVVPASNTRLSGTNSYIDEAYASIISDTLGRIDIGSENSAGYKSMVAAPEIGITINSNSITAFIPLTFAPFRTAGGSAYTEVAGNNDIDRLTYYTPSIAGLTLGVSYARNNSSNAVASHNDNDPSAGATVENIYDVGLNYNQSFGEVSVTLGARYGSGDPTTAGRSDPDTWGIGGQIGFGDFSFGAHYAESDNVNVQSSTRTGAANDGNFGAQDQSGWSVGIGYDMPGPWNFTVGTFQGEQEANFNNNGAQVAVQQDYEAYKVVARRTLGPGVSWDVFYVNAQNRRTPIAGRTGASAGGTVDGNLFGTTLNLSF